MSSWRTCSTQCASCRVTPAAGAAAAGFACALPPASGVPSARAPSAERPRFGKAPAAAIDAAAIWMNDRLPTLAIVPPPRRNALPRCFPFCSTARSVPATRLTWLLDAARRTSIIGLRNTHDSLAGAWCAELLDRALHPVVLAIALLRGNAVVVGRPWLEALHAHAECGGWMALVQPDGRFRRLAQILGIRAVVHDAQMIVRPARVVSGPPDDGQKIGGQLQLWPFDDRDARGFLRRRNYLTGGLVGKEQAADRARDRTCQKQSIHDRSPSLGLARYLIGGFGKGATPQIAAGHAGRGGVGIRNSFPWVDAEPPVKHVPVKALM